MLRGEYKVIFLATNECTNMAAPIDTKAFVL